MSEDKDLLDYLEIFRRRKDVIIIVTTVCVLVTGIISLLIPRTYETDALLKIGRVMSLTETRFIEDPHTVISIAESDSFLSIFNDQYHLGKSLKTLKKSLSVDMPPGSYGIVRITGRGPTPGEAAAMVNKFCDFIILQHTNIQQPILNLNNDIQKNLSEQIESQEKILASTKEPGDDVKDASLKSRILADIDSRRQIHLDAVQSRLITLRDSLDRLRTLTSISRAETTHIINPPLLPVYPISPRRKLNVLFAGLGGAALSVFLALALEYFGDKSAKNGK